MDALSKALAYAIAFLDSAERESDSDADDDANALEGIVSFLTELTAAERQALQNAAQLAIRTEQQAEQPNYSLIQGYRSLIEHLAETEG